MKRSLLRTLLRILSFLKALTGASKNPSKKHLPLKKLLRTLLRSVLLHDPLGVHPKFVMLKIRWQGPISSLIRNHLAFLRTFCGKMYTRGHVVKQLGGP